MGRPKKWMGQGRAGRRKSHDEKHAVARTPAQQLARLDQRGHRAVRERARLKGAK